MSEDNAEHISETAAAKLLPVSSTTLRRMRCRGEAPRHWKTPSGGVVRYRKSDVLEFREKNWSGGEPPEHEGAA